MADEVAAGKAPAAFPDPAPCLFAESKAGMRCLGSKYYETFI